MQVGVEMGKKGEVKVDEFNQSSVPSIYAVGDVTDRVNLTPVALMEGMAFAKNIFGYVPLYTADAGFASMNIATDRARPSPRCCCALHSLRCHAVQQVAVTGLHGMEGCSCMHAELVCSM